MTELPPETKAFGKLKIYRDNFVPVIKKIYIIFHICLGLGPRKFRSRNFDPGDRSVWTDTPADQLKKAQVVT